MTKNDNSNKKVEDKRVSFHALLQKELPKKELAETKSEKELKALSKKVTNLFREHAMESNDIKLDSLIVITNDGNVGLTPITVSMLHSEIGPMMLKAMIKTINKSSETGDVSSILELMFVRGLYQQHETKEECEATAKKYQGLSGEELYNHPDMHDYMISNIYTKECLTTNMHDVIMITDNRGKNTDEGFVVSPKANKSQKLKYNTENVINYFE